MGDGTGPGIQDKAKETEEGPAGLGDWEDIFSRLDQQDGVRDGQILRAALLSWLDTLHLQEALQLEVMEGVTRDTVRQLVFKVDKDMNGYISKSEFMQLIEAQSKTLELQKSSRLLTFLRVAAFADHYRWWPPPAFTLGLTIALIAVFVHQTVEQDSAGVALSYPKCSPLTLHPMYHHEPWRLLTYSLTHHGVEHLLVNLLLVLLVGLPLEMTHGSLRVGLVYVLGVLAASLTYSLAKPCGALVGCSAGVYALTTAHLATIALNWREDSLVVRQRLRDSRATAPTYGKVVRVCRVLVIMGILMMDIVGRLVTPTTNTSYTAHATGSLVGLVVGLVVLRNRRVEHWETWVKAVACVLVSSLLVVLAGLQVLAAGQDMEGLCRLQGKLVCPCANTTQQTCPRLPAH